MTENDRKYLRKRLMMMSEYYETVSPKGTSPAVLAWMNEAWLLMVDIVRKLDEEDEDEH